jgi:hypothetical protein
VPTPAPTPGCQITVGITCKTFSDFPCDQIVQTRDPDNCVVELLEFSIDICNTAATLASISQFDIRFTPGELSQLTADPIAGNSCGTQLAVIGAINPCVASSTSQFDVFVRSPEVCIDGVSATVLVTIIPLTTGI